MIIYIEIKTNSYIIPSSRNTSKSNKDYDILYIIDSTYSMVATLDLVKKYVLEIANKTKNALPDYNIKYGVIYYHDVINGGAKNIYLNFTDNMTELQNFVNNKSAEGISRRSG